VRSEFPVSNFIPPFAAFVVFLLHHPRIFADGGVGRRMLHPRSALCGFAPLREECLSVTGFVPGGLVGGREDGSRPFERIILTQSRQAAKKTVRGGGLHEEHEAHEGMPEGGPTFRHPPSAVLFVEKKFEQEHAEKEWDGGRDGLRSTPAPSFAALRLCVRNAFLRRFSFMAGSSEDERMGHDPSAEEFSRQAAKPQRRPQMGRGKSRRTRSTRRGCRKAGPPSGIPLSPSFVVFVVDLSAPSARSVVSSSADFADGR
jgi:hypothetical protein